MDPFTLLAGGGLLLAGYILGRANRQARKPPPPDTECPGCRHSISYRDPQTGRCTHQSQKESEWDADGEAIAYAWTPCHCANHATADQLLIGGTGWEAPRPISPAPPDTP